MDDVGRSCWCGEEALQPFSPNYLLCSNCGTLVAQAGLSEEETLVRDDEVDYYGKRYWLEHQRDELHLPDIYTRAKQDLPERCVHWLKTLLCYVQPPAKVLEVGAGHGAYTALLRWAGYDATALDVSPWVAEFAKMRFGIPYLVGPVEEQKLRSRSFDVVVANDVLEHLASPLATMRRCVNLLKPKGLLVIQTPEYPRGRTYDQLLAGDDLFLEHMHRAWSEHLYLFSREALELLLSKLGVDETAFEEPVFPYDMMCVASRVPLRRTDADLGDVAAGAPTAPMVLALIDAHDAGKVRLEAIERLEAALGESEADRAERLKMIKQVSARLKRSEADRQARLEAIGRLEAALGESEADRQARLEAMRRLDAHAKQLAATLRALDAELKRSEADREARLEVIQRLDAALKGREGRNGALGRRGAFGEVTPLMRMLEKLGDRQ